METLTSSSSPDAPAVGDCVLGNPNHGLTGRFTRDGRILFGARPEREWEFMATGTGVTSLIVNVPGQIVMQINHASSIDEDSRLRALARLHLDLAGSPFAQAKAFRMEHDLRRSVISAIAETDDGVVRVDIRAHVEADVIRIDIEDQRRAPGAVLIRLEEDAPSEVAYRQETGLWLWHENGAGRIAPPEPQSDASGPPITRGNRDWQAGRVFGVCVSPEAGANARVEGRALQLPPASRHTLYVAGASTLGGQATFAQTVSDRLARIAKQHPDEFERTHEAWWNAFWARASFVPGDSDGSMSRHKAAFDLYRYYLACCAGERRETPARFQIDLYRYHLRDFDWLTGVICAVEQYQSYYGAMRTGDWAALRNLAGFYERNLPYYRYCAQRMYGHAGARIPMWHTPQIIDPEMEPAPGLTPTGVPAAAYNGENPAGALWVLSLLLDYVDISGDEDFAAHVLKPLAVDLVEFLRLQYPRREQGRMVIAPCNAGETWQGVRDPAEMVCAFHATLPRLVALAKSRDWDNRLVAGWEEMLAALPAIPRGRLDYRGPAARPMLVAGDRLAPAADMSDCEAYVLGWSNGEAWYQLNAQHTELYAVWPAKLVFRDAALKESATWSYRERLFQHHWDGWNLDVVFAACLGLQDEVARWFDEHFDHTFVLPCGLARETAPENPRRAGLPECPSLQGMGTGVIPVLEMLLQDYPDELVVLPCWPDHVPVDFTLYSPYAGQVIVHYAPADGSAAVLQVTTQRAIQVSTAIGGNVELRVEHAGSDGH